MAVKRWHSYSSPDEVRLTNFVLLRGAMIEGMAPSRKEGGQAELGKVNSRHHSNQPSSFSVCHFHHIVGSTNGDVYLSVIFWLEYRCAFKNLNETAAQEWRLSVQIVFSVELAL